MQAWPRPWHQSSIGVHPSGDRLDFVAWSAGHWRPRIAKRSIAIHIAILFYADTVKTSHGRPNLTWGRVVANHSLISALIAARSQNRLTLFVPTQPDVQLLRDTLLPDVSDEISIVPFLAIPDFLGENPIDVLHTLDPNMWFGAHIRNFLSSDDFVVTGLTHSLANEHFLSWALQGNANGIDQADCLICTTPTARAVIESTLARLKSNQPEFRAPRTQVIPLGVDLESFQRHPAAGREQLGLTEDEFVILSFARFNPQFKMDYLPLLNLATMIRAKAKRRVRLVLAGASDDGSYSELVRDWVQRLGLNDAVQFVLDPEEDLKIALYRQADVFLSLSDNVQETFGLTVIEAMASGLPVVASDWNGYKALVDEGINGYLVPSKTLPSDLGWEAGMSLQPDSMMHLYSAQTTAIDLPHACDALLRLAGDESLTARMAEAARNAAKRFDWPQVAAQYFALWRELAERRPRNAIRPLTRNSFLQVLDDFAGYPTSRLSPDDSFQTSDLGHLVLQRKRTLYLYGQLAEIMDLNILDRLLKTCTVSKSVAELEDQLCPGNDAAQAAIRRNLMWLYKYGLVDLR